MPAKSTRNGDNCCSILSETTLIEQSNFQIPCNSDPRWLSEFSNEICFCNGVICINSQFRASNTLYLCNPSLRKLKILPPSCIDVALSGRIRWVFGFGVDNVSGDYKVVRIFYNPRESKARPRVEVYSLRSDSWKMVELNFNVSYVHYFDFSSIFCNGAIHWFADGDFYRGLGHGDFYKPGVILSFNLCDEVFYEMELPVGLPLMKKRGYVFLFKESLSLFIETVNENPFEGLRYEVWIMKEYGVVESWTKEFTGLVKGVRGDLEIGFSKSGKVIFRKNDGMLAVLDLECGQVEVESIGFHEKLYIVADYMESLVLLEDGVSFRALSEFVSNQTDGGGSCSGSSAVEDCDG